MATRVFKLITGEEIIGQVEDPISFTNIEGPGYLPEPVAYVEVKRVRTITRLSMQTPGGIQFINTMSPYLGGSPTDNLRLKPEHIIVECDPEQDLERVYQKDVSGIELATAIPRGRG